MIMGGITEEKEQSTKDEEPPTKNEENPDEHITTEPNGESSSKTEPNVIQDALSSQRVFKKSSPNNKLTLYLSSRDLIVTDERIDRLQGVVLIDPEFVENRKVFAQVTLTFRYGREDEEVMGLKFCNEAVMCLAQLYPPPECAPQYPTTVLQEALIKRLGPNAHPFTMEVTPLAPPSVQLVPAKEYNGAPIGTSYDIRAYIAERPDEKLQKKTTVRMGIRVVQRATAPPTPQQYTPGSAQSLPQGQRTKCRLHQDVASPINGSLAGSTHSTPAKQIQISQNNDDTTNVSSDNESSQIEHIKTDGAVTSPVSFPDVPAPHAQVDKPFLLSDGRVTLEASLDKAIYSHGEQVLVRVLIRNNSGKTVRRMKVFVVQYVDVCMFSNGKFKNVVAMISPREDLPVGPGKSLERTYALQPSKGQTKNWIALEDSYSKSGTSLASTVVPRTNTPDDRNVFAIYVSYYVKVKLLVSVMGGELSLKLPFTLMHTCPEYPPAPTSGPPASIKPDKDGTA